jgi:hypothetical protein
VKILYIKIPLNLCRADFHAFLVNYSHTVLKSFSVRRYQYTEHCSASDEKQRNLSTYCCLFCTEEQWGRACLSNANKYNILTPSEGFRATGCMEIYLVLHHSKSVVTMRPQTNSTVNWCPPWPSTVRLSVQFNGADVIMSQSNEPTS